jgi:hypothetical protein
MYKPVIRGGLLGLRDFLFNPDAQRLKRDVLDYCEIIKPHKRLSSYLDRASL